jgi:hypothetical protein
MSAGTQTDYYDLLPDFTGPAAEKVAGFFERTLGF